MKLLPCLVVLNWLLFYRHYWKHEFMSYCWKVKKITYTDKYNLPWNDRVNGYSVFRFYQFINGSPTKPRVTNCLTIILIGSFDTFYHIIYNLTSKVYTFFDHFLYGYAFSSWFLFICLFFFLILLQTIPVIRKTCFFFFIYAHIIICVYIIPYYIKNPR